MIITVWSVLIWVCIDFDALIQIWIERIVDKRKNSKKMKMIGRKMEMKRMDNMVKDFSNKTTMMMWMTMKQKMPIIRSKSVMQIRTQGQDKNQINK